MLNARTRRRKPLKIGITPRLLHPEAGAVGIRSKPVMYLEESVAFWVMSRDVMVMMVPVITRGTLLSRGDIKLKDYVDHLDGLVLQGGADLSPTSYGEEPLRPEWAGDKTRDDFERELLLEFVDARKPVLGICRGAQLINVAFGGTLYQDIPTQHDQAIVHRHEEHYDAHGHAIAIVPGSGLAKLYPQGASGNVISIHHQAAHKLGRHIKVEARSEPDGLPEAIRLDADTYVFGVQWHPEFHRPNDATLMDCTPIREEFLAEARKRA